MDGHTAIAEDFLICERQKSSIFARRIDFLNKFRNALFRRLNSNCATTQ